MNIDATRFAAAILWMRLISRILIVGMTGRPLGGGAGGKTRAPSRGRSRVHKPRATRVGAALLIAGRALAARGDPVIGNPPAG